MRQFIADKNLDETGCLYIEGKNYRYLSSVLRSKAGDMMHVRLPDSSLVQMTVAKVDESSKKVVLQLAGDGVSKLAENKAVAAENKPDVEFILFQFIAKPPKMELIIRQATECGVCQIVPVAGEFCQKGNIESAKSRSGSKDERWGRIITEARQQSGSPVDTKVSEVLSVEECARMWRDAEGEKRGVVLYEQTAGTKPLSSVFGGFKKGKVALAVGAEGGISPDEIRILEGAGFVPVHFDTNILRCETAALYGIAAVQTRVGDN